MLQCCPFAAPLLPPADAARPFALQCCPCSPRRPGLFSTRQELASSQTPFKSSAPFLHVCPFPALTNTVPALANTAGKYTPGGPKPSGPRAGIYSKKIEEVQPLIEVRCILYIVDPLHYLYAITMWHLHHTNYAVPCGSDTVPSCSRRTTERTHAHTYTGDACYWQGARRQEPRADCAQLDHLQGCAAHPWR